MFTLNADIFFLSIPISGFIPSDRVVWNGPLRLAFSDRRNSSLRSSVIEKASVKAWGLNVTYGFKKPKKNRALSMPFQSYKLSNY
ncbi:hypothetical protein DW919_17205 [Odoribacter splanchnicus]|nr:hypothetical protein DW919_17205 [Odoribacter splanchnicus]